MQIWEDLCAQLAFRQSSAASSFAAQIWSDPRDRISHYPPESENPLSSSPNVRRTCQSNPPALSLMGESCTKMQHLLKKRKTCQVDLFVCLGETFHSCQSWHPSPEKISRVLKLWRRPLKRQTEVVPERLFMISYRTPVCADKGKTTNCIQI